MAIGHPLLLLSKIEDKSRFFRIFVRSLNDSTIIIIVALLINKKSEFILIGLQ